MCVASRRGNGNETRRQAKLGGCGLQKVIKKSVCGYMILDPTPAAADMNISIITNYCFGMAHDEICKNLEQGRKGPERSAARGEQYRVYSSTHDST